MQVVGLGAGAHFQHLLFCCLSNLACSIQPPKFFSRTCLLEPYLGLVASPREPLPPFPLPLHTQSYVVNKQNTIIRCNYGLQLCTVLSRAAWYGCTHRVGRLEHTRQTSGKYAPADVCLIVGCMQGTSFV